MLKFVNKDSAHRKVRSMTIVKIAEKQIIKITFK